METLNETEIWKTISEHPNYQVSNKGRVIALNYRHTGKKHLLSQLNGKTGYKFVILEKKTCYVHRLVAEAFIPNPQNLPQINHKDENKANNTVQNIEWCSEKYNVNYGTRIQRMKNTIEEKRNKRMSEWSKRNQERIEQQRIEREKAINELNQRIMKNKVESIELKRELAALKRIDTWEWHSVLQFDLDGNLIKEWKSPYDVQKKLGLSISKCLVGKCESIGGFKWMYKIAR